jgi:hypothetical protein
MNQRQNMSGYTSEDIENAILSGIVKTLQIMKDVREEGDDLNSIDFDEVIEMRIRDMTDRSIYDAIQCVENSDEQ